MRKLYFFLSMLLLVGSLKAQTITTLRTLSWKGGSADWTSSAGGWNTASNWTDLATGNNASSAPKNGDKLIIPNNVASQITIKIKSDMTFAYSNFIIEIQGNAKMEIAAGFELTLSSSSASFSLKSATRPDAFRLKASTVGNPTKLNINSIVKAMNTTGSDKDLSGSYAAAGFESLAASSSGFAGFNLGALPVILVAFDAVKQSNGVLVSWKTQQEVSAKEFVIEKSTDGRSFVAIATVAAAGFSSTPRSYSYVDGAANNGMAYYRVRMYDVDGKSGVTAIRAVRSAAAVAKVGIYPNPAVAVANIVVNAPDAAAFNINVFNRNGQLIGQQKAAAGTSMVSLNVSGYPAGDYTVDVQFADGTRQSSKLIVGGK